MDTVPTKIYGPLVRLRVFALYSRTDDVMISLLILLLPMLANVSMFGQFPSHRNKNVINEFSLPSQNCFIGVLTQFYHQSL